MATIIQLRNDTAANFTQYNPTLAEGEIGLELDTKKIKVGDGVKTWNQLDYWVGPLTSEQVIVALGYTPYDSSNPSGYISGITSSDVITALGFTPYDSNNPDGFISGITSSDVTTALGYTPATAAQGALADSAVQSVNNISAVDGNVSITIDDVAPAQSGQSGKYLTTDGTTATWGTVDALPSQAGQSGKYLTTDGTAASWEAIPDPNNGALTIEQNGTIVGTFTANQSTDVTVNVTDTTYGAGNGLRLANDEYNILQEDYGSNPIPNIVGTLTNVQDRIYTGFSDNNYFEFANPLILNGTDSYEFQFCYRCPVSSTTAYGLFYFGNNIYGVRATAVRYARSSVELPSAATYTFDITNDGSTFTTLNIKRTVDSQNNTFTDLIRTSDNYGQTWTTVEERTYSGALDSRTATLRLGTGLSHGLNETGRINLDYCFIKVNEVDWWNPSASTYKPAAKATNNLYGLIKPDNLSITVNDGVISASITDNVTSTSTTSALSANMGKELQDQVDNLKARGRFLALWDCSTGLPESNPPENPYTYATGDYYVVGNVASSEGTNYKPNGASYTEGVASTTVETAEVSIDDCYFYDGTNWRLQNNTQKTLSFVNIAGDPYDNSNLAAALNSKQDELPAQTGQSGKFLTTNGTAISWGDAPVTDVQVNGTSIVTSGVANIPYGTNAVAGLAKAGSGLASMTGGTFYIYPATDGAIQAKTNAANPIVPSNLNKAVMEGLGNNSLTWTDAYKASARNTIGATQAVFVDWSD